VKRWIDPQPSGGRMCPSVPADMPGAQARYLPDFMTDNKPGWYWITDSGEPAADAELSRLRAEVSRLTAALAAETLAVERLAELCDDCPDNTCGTQHCDGAPDCVTCRMAWARQPKEVCK